MRVERPRCGGPRGKIIYTREEARVELAAFRVRNGGRGSKRWCVFCGNYHLTRNKRGK
jgi:hypothetical protein